MYRPHRHLHAPGTRGVSVGHTTGQHQCQDDGVRRRVAAMGAPSEARAADRGGIEGQCPQCGEEEKEEEEEAKEDHQDRIIIVYF